MPEPVSQDRGGGGGLKASPNPRGVHRPTFPPKRSRRTRPDREVKLLLKPPNYDFVRAVAFGAAREYACYGSRGERKTSSVLAAMLEHAKQHQLAGYPLPVPWIGVTDTFAAHKLKTKRSLLASYWRGTWQLSQDDHVAIARVDGQETVALDLFGIEDQGAMDRVRMETVGVWFEEPAPSAMMVQSSGISDMAWSIALTSQRLASHCHPAVMTLNYPDEDHWTWKRFLPGVRETADAPTSGRHPDDSTRMWFQIPPRTNANERQVAEWTHALRDRPDLLRRLIEGKPGVVLLGPQVAEGFREDLHVARVRLKPIENEPLHLGQDFGHTPATIIAQPWRGELRMLAALPCEHGGIRQHLEVSVKPWLARHAPWTLQGGRQWLRGCYDQAGETGEESDIERSPVEALEKGLGGIWWPGPITWESRKHCLLSALNRHTSPGQLALQIDPVDGQPLIRALSGRWHYPVDRLGAIRRDLPKKPNHPWEDLGDALIYCLWGMTDQQPASSGPPRVETEFALSMPALGGRW